MTSLSVVDKLKRLLEDTPDVRLAVLFGSAAKTALRPGSDIDLGLSFALGYALVDYPRVHREAQTGIPALRSFLAAVLPAAGCRADDESARLGA